MDCQSLKHTLYLLTVAANSTAMAVDQTSITVQLFEVIELKLSIDFQIISITFQLAFGAFEQLLTT